MNYLKSNPRVLNLSLKKDDKGILSFLDKKVERKNSSLSTPIYRILSFTGLSSRFDSSTPDKYKDNLMATSVHRGFRLCSSHLSFNTEVNFLKLLLKQNSYPLSPIAKTISKVLKNCKFPLVQRPQSDKISQKKLSIFPHIS